MRIGTRLGLYVVASSSVLLVCASVSAFGLTTLALLIVTQSVMVWLLIWSMVTVPLGRLRERMSRLPGSRSDDPNALHDDDFAALGAELDRVERALAATKSQLQRAQSEQKLLLDQVRHGARLRMAGLLSSSLVHELGTPLAIIALQAHLVEQMQMLPEAAQKRAQAILKQAASMKNIIQNVLSFTRRGHDQRSDLDLQQVVERAVSMLEPMAKQLGIEVRVLSQGEAVVAADETQLLQVLTNLLVNAFHATRDKAASRSQVSVEIATTRAQPLTASPMARMAVRDRGVGITPEVRSHLFEPFFTTKQDQGTGLGLAVTSGIVNDHGGRIFVEDNAGGGSVFVVELPLAQHGLAVNAPPPL